MRRAVAAVAAIGFAAALAPATAAGAPLIAAYDTHAGTNGFDIGLVNVSAGQQIALPSGVNTTDDELHPALTPDGRHLVWMRTKLQPKLNGDIVPPAERTLHVLNRDTGAIQALPFSQGGGGPVFTPAAPNPLLAWGIRPAVENPFTILARHAPFLGSATTRHPATSTTFPAPDGVLLDATHAAVTVTGSTLVPGSSINDPSSNTLVAVPTHARYLSLAYVDAVSGALRLGVAQLSEFRENPDGTVVQGAVDSFGNSLRPASHPVPRSGDGYVAMDLTSSGNANIQTVSWPAEHEITAAPAPITTADSERMPAWSPDGIQLGFVRTTAGKRSLVVFDATPGIQSPLNTPIDLGADAPTPQTRAYQSSWGGLSLALARRADAPTVMCTSSGVCVSQSGGSGVRLSPRVTGPVTNVGVGIVVARITGSRELLGRKVPRIRRIGRVPLGRATNGRNGFRWDGEVNGRPLPPGRYLLTFRTLRRGRVLSISQSLRFTVTRDGEIEGVRILR